MLNAVNLFDSFAGMPNATPAQIADNLSGAFAAPMQRKESSIKNNCVAHNKVNGG